MRTKLHTVEDGLPRRMQRAIAERGQNLRLVAGRLARYLVVPCVGARLATFSLQAPGLWHRTKCGRSQPRSQT